MSGPSLADRFRLERRAVITVDGDRVRAAFGLPVPAGATLRLRRRFASTARPQGLRLVADVDLLVGDTAARDLTLWTTTAPDVVEVRLATDRDTTVQLWNTWWSDGVAQAWLGNAGFLIETDLTGDDPVVVLWCSDGVGEVSFDDLVVAVEVVVPASPAPAPAPAAAHEPLPLSSIPTA